MALVAEMRKTLDGAQVAATEHFRKERAAFMVFKGDQRLALGLLYHPVRHACYLVPASKLAVDTREKPLAFFALDGARVGQVEQIGFDRLIDITLETPGGIRHLILEAIGPNGNVWLLDDSRRILASLRKKEFAAGDVYEPPAGRSRIDPLNTTGDTLHEQMQEADDLPVAHFVERHIDGFSPSLALELAARCDLLDDNTHDLTHEQARLLVDGIGKIAEFFRRPESGYVTARRGKFEAFPFKLKCADGEPEKYKTLSLAIKAASELNRDVREAVDEEKRVRDAVGRGVRRLAKRLKSVEGDIEKAANFDLYRRMGELLKINLDQLRRGMESIELPDIYSDHQEPLRIPLDPALTPNDNVEQYFKQYRKGKEGLELLQRRREITAGELAALEEIEQALAGNFEHARQQYAEDIAALLPGEASSEQAAPRMPFKEYTLSTGLKIFVGRDGADNDRTTFEFARPYELWFHASQCPGSHVVMKFPTKNFEPSKREIEETAAIAAWFSKARNDSAVPVAYTQKKYVRKPRKAKPGLVTIEREKSVMVEPRSPELLGLTRA